MALHGTVELDWADDRHSFCLTKMAHVLELEDKCGAGIYEIFQRLKDNRWRYMDVRESIRLALIGGGASPPAALALVRRYVEGQPIGDNALVAFLILSAAVVGVPGDAVGKTEADQTKTEPSSSTTQMDGLSGPQSTASAPA